MKEIKKIDKRSLANAVAAITGIVIFFAVFCLAVFNVFNIANSANFSGSIFMVFLFNVGAGLIISVIAGAVAMIPGYFVGYVAAIGYDVFAKRFGGIKIELTDDNK